MGKNFENIETITSTILKPPLSQVYPWI